MSIVEVINIKIDTCTNGAYLRWYYNGWHYRLFSNRYTTEEDSKVNGKQTVEVFSAISRVEKSTSRESRIYITVGETNITPNDIEVYKGLLIVQTVQLYQLGQWVRLEIERSSFSIKPTKLNKFTLELRAELKEILSDVLVLPPTQEPSENIIFEDYFLNWQDIVPIVPAPPWNLGFFQWATIPPYNRTVVNNSLQWRLQMWNNDSTPVGADLHIADGSSGMKFYKYDNANALVAIYILPTPSSGMHKITVTVRDSYQLTAGYPLRIIVKNINLSNEIANSITYDGTFTFTVNHPDLQIIEFLFRQGSGVRTQRVTIEHIKIVKINE